MPIIPGIKTLRVNSFAKAKWETGETILPKNKVTDWTLCMQKKWLAPGWCLNMERSLLEIFQQRLIILYCLSIRCQSIKQKGVLLFSRWLDKEKIKTLNV